MYKCHMTLQHGKEGQILITNIYQLTITSLYLPYVGMFGVGKMAN